MSGISGHEKPNKGETDTWLTPLSIVESLGRFDLDPCGFPGHNTAEKLICLPDDGFNTNWEGRVWLNPPYSEVGKWIQKLADHGNGIALVFARTETKWAQEVLPRASSVLFLSGRIKFINPNKAKTGNAGAPSMFLAFGEKPKWKLKGWEAQ